MEIEGLYLLAEEEGIEVDNFQMNMLSAVSVMEEDLLCHIALDESKFGTQAERKVALAHEMGHCVTGSFYSRYSPHDIKEKHERRADKRAVFMLVPLMELMDAVDSGVANVWALSERFGVTEGFMRKALEIYESELRRIYGSK